MNLENTNLYKRMLRFRMLYYLPKRLCSTQPVNEIEIVSGIIVKKYDLITLITINNPSKRNALNASLVNDLQKTVKEFENDEGSLAGVICGEGGNFCAGYDLEEFARSEDIPGHVVLNNVTENYVRKPLVAAVNGYAVGLGLDLALWCDLRIMDETAVLGCFGRRFGSSMSEAGISRLQAIVGFSKALDIVLSGKRIKSEEALNNGLANRVVSCGTAVGTAVAIAGDLTKFPQAALLNDRAVLYKYSSTRIHLRNNHLIDEDCVRHKNQILKDLKRGAQLFIQGAGKHGALFSKYLWKEESL